MRFRLLILAIALMILSGCSGVIRPKWKCPNCHANPKRYIWRPHDHRFLRIRAIEYECGSVGRTNTYLLYIGEKYCKKSE